jgi:hypothetical protein
VFTVYCRALDLGRLLPMGLLRAALQVRTVRTLEVDYNGREYCDIFSPRIIGSQESHTIFIDRLFNQGLTVCNKGPFSFNNWFVKMMGVGLHYFKFCASLFILSNRRQI